MIQATDFDKKNNPLQTWVKDNAWVVCEFNGNNMSNHIETLLNDELLSEMFGNHEKKLIEEKYKCNKVSKQKESIYHDCINSY